MKITNRMQSRKNGFENNCLSRDDNLDDINTFSNSLL